MEKIEEKLPSVEEAANTDLLALWRDPEVSESIMVGREELLRQRMSDPLKGGMSPHLAHETRDDLLRPPQAAARAMSARAHELPEPIEAAYKRRKDEWKEKDKAKSKASVFSEALRREYRDVGDAAPFRARAAYRIIREHARLKNLIEDDESMVEALGIDPNQPGDPWRAPTSILAPKRRDKSTRLTAPAWHSLEALQELPLLPPAVPLEFRDTGDGPGATGDMTVLQSYSPKRDKAYVDWLDGSKMIAEYLGIADGSKNDREQGMIGLKGMFDPTHCRLLWPSRYEIIAVEASMIENCLEQMIDSGIPGAIKWLAEEHGLLRREAQSIIKLAKAQARDTVDSDVEDNRALMALRLEQYLERSKLSFDLRSEMSALKLLTLIQGLSKSKPEDIASDFIEIVARVASRRNSDQILPGDEKTIDALPSSGSDSGFEAARDSSSFVEKG